MVFGKDVKYSILEGVTSRKVNEGKFESDIILKIKVNKDTEDVDIVDKLNDSYANKGVIFNFEDSKVDGDSKIVTVIAFADMDKGKAEDWVKGIVGKLGKDGIITDSWKVE